MKKRYILVAMVMAMLIGTYSVAAAADKNGATRNSLKSFGTIEYHKGSDKVIIDSDDLYMLADQIDQVKFDVTDQLEALNTYFTSGDGISLSTDRNINVAHNRPSKGDSVDPVAVNFDTLLEGIAASQSVSSNVTDYGYSSGTKFYKKADGSLTTDGTGEGTVPINVTAATAENLSAGTAAWVNGRLILGTGGDNKSYFEQGYRKGEDDNKGSGNSGGNVNKAKIIDLKDNNMSYLVTEDIKNAFIYFHVRNLPTLAFETLSTDPEVAFEKILHQNSNVVNTVIYYIPELKKNTLIKITSNSETAAAQLITTNDAATGKGIAVNLRGEDDKQTSYLVQEDLQDVFMVRVNATNVQAPTFMTSDNTVVAIKQIGSSTCYHPSYHNTVFYIPELKAGTSITDYGNSYLFY